MKRILLTLCIFIVLASLANAEGYYNCVDKDGNTVLTTTPQDGMKCEMKGGSDESYRENEQANLNTGISRRDEMKLDDLYNKAISKSEDKNKSVGGAANYLCLAEVISTVKSRGKSVNPKFLDKVDDILKGYRNYSVGGLLNAIQGAASIQSVNTSNIGPCTTAMIHSY